MLLNSKMYYFAALVELDLYSITLAQKELY